MSGEQLTLKEINRKPKSFTDRTRSLRVDINHLISRTRQRNKKEKVYGTLFSVVGNAASQFQFFLTDSSNNFLVGSLYFYSKPNYDSLYPAIKYIEKDIFHLFNTLKWK